MYTGSSSFTGFAELSDMATVDKIAKATHCSVDLKMLCHNYAEIMARPQKFVNQVRIGQYYVARFTGDNCMQNMTEADAEHD